MLEPQQLELEQIRQHLSQSVSAAPDLHTALCLALSQVGEATGWDYGEAWIPCPQRLVLELSSAYYISPRQDSILGFALEQFRLCSEAFILPPATGLPGRVWSSQQPEWIADVSAESETYFLRNQIAKACSVKAGLGVPLIADRQVVAVLVFFSSTARAEDRQLLQEVAAIVNQLGELLQL